MKKILFYTGNGVGLGHLRRIQLIAEALKTENKNIKIILVTLARSPQAFGGFFHRLIQLLPPSDELLKNPSSTLAVRLANGRQFARTLKKFKPDLIVADFHLASKSKFTFYPFGFAVDHFPTKSIFIWRIGTSDSFCYDFKNKTSNLDYFQKIILPHSQDELGSLLPTKILQNVQSNPKFKICGPIFKRPDKKMIIYCRHKYKISSKDFLLTLTLGGSGVLKKGECESPAEIFKNLLSIYPRLVDLIPNLKIIVSTGPYFQARKIIFPRLMTIQFEKYMPELLCLSKLVISPAGYNTCNELIGAQTPAILIPLKRGENEQFGRIFYLEKKGIVKICHNNSPHHLLNLIIDCKENLDKMKMNFKKFSHYRQGNLKAGKIILNSLNSLNS